MTFYHLFCITGHPLCGHATNLKMNENSPPDVRLHNSLLGPQGQDSSLQNINILTKTCEESSAAVETSERYVPEPATAKPKRNVTRSKSNPEQQMRSVQATPTSARASEPATGTVSRNTKEGARLSQGNVSPRRSESINAPLYYFAYLGKLNPKLLSKRCVSTRNILTSRQVIITSTSFVSPNVTNALQLHIEEEQVPNDHHFTTEDYKEMVECCTCVCCVKAMFYHCTKDDEEEGRVAEHPCSCRGPRDECLPRWGILGTLSLCLPCLWCYLPFKACEKFYGWSRGWLAEREQRAEEARQAEPVTASDLSSSGYVESYEPVNLRRQEAFRVQDPYGILMRGRYVDIDTLNRV